MNKVNIFLVILCLLTGCVSTKPADDKLALITLTRPDGKETVYLPNDYGFLITWNDTEQPQFYLYEKSPPRIRIVDDFDTFLAELKKFPDGAEVDWIRNCASLYWAMPLEQQARLRKALKSKEFELTDHNDNNFVICTCESKDLTILKTTALNH